MNINKLNEELTKIQENELAEKKAKHRIYQAAWEALENLQELLEDGRDPATDKLDTETEAFYDKLTSIGQEIYSRAQAFEV